MHFEPKVYWLFFLGGKIYCSQRSRYKFHDNSLISNLSSNSSNTLLAMLPFPKDIWANFYKKKICWTTLLAFVFKSQNKSPCPCFYIKRYYCLDCYIAFCYLENDGIDFERYIQFTNEKAAMWMSKVLCIFFLLSVLDFIHYNLLRDDDWFISGLWNLMVP